MPEPIELIPVRMLVQYTFCPRLYALMHVEGRWDDNAYTEDGKQVHHRVDEEDEPLPDPDPKEPGDEEPKVARSVPLSSETLGLTGKTDVVELEGQVATPVEYKRGAVPNTPERSWEPERVQLMAQALLLREAGYQVERGFLWFARSRTRVEVPFTAELEARTLALIEEARALATRHELPPPLDYSPKCLGCSLNGICLPDETELLRQERQGWQTPENQAEKEVRRLFPARDDAVPLYVQDQGAYVGKRGEALRVTKEGKEILSARLIDVSQLVLCGNISISPAVLHLCAEGGVPVVHLSMGHWFYGITQGFGLRNAYDRAAQFAAAAKPDICLALAKAFVAAKGGNQRTLLRRNGTDVPDMDLQAMANLLKQAEDAADLPQLLGFEGNIARHYFANFPRMLKPRLEGDWGFDDFARNRRPPKDPINALMSFGYAVLAKECAVALTAVGLDPHWGFYHQPRHGRPALALDLMEEFRPLVVDSAVITAVNTGMVGPKDFERTKSACMLNAKGRKAFLQAYEARLDHLATHPVFDYRCSWRRIIAIQAQLLARHLRGELPKYPGMVTR
jgi:CRISPR-associated protein Cas1